MTSLIWISLVNSIGSFRAQQYPTTVLYFLLSLYFSVKKLKVELYETASSLMF